MITDGTDREQGLPDLSRQQKRDRSNAYQLIDEWYELTEYMRDSAQAQSGRSVSAQEQLRIALLMHESGHKAKGTTIRFPDGKNVRVDASMRTYINAKETRASRGTVVPAINFNQNDQELLVIFRQLEFINPRYVAAAFYWAKDGSMSEAALSMEIPRVSFDRYIEGAIGVISAFQRMRQFGLFNVADWKL